MPQSPNPLRPARALAHPLWWAALALLILNDHAFKGAGILPAGLTGKLSDFAGMLVAPALLATLVGVRGRGGLLRAHLAVGLGFAAINLSPAAANAVETLASGTPWPWFITVDPTDLWALPTLALSWRVLGGFMMRPVPVTAVLARLGVAAGAWACVATSPPPEEYVDVGVPTEAATVEGHLVLVNTLDVPQRVRVRALLPNVRIDCSAVERDPEGTLDAEFFGPAETWEIEPGRELGLVNNGPVAACVVWRLDGPSLPLRDAVVNANNHPRTQYTVAEAEASGHAIHILPEGWGESAFLRPVGGEIEGEPVPAECQQPATGAGLNWTVPDDSQVRIAELSLGADGCHRIGLSTAASFAALSPEASGEVMYVCTGGLELPFEVGERIGVIQVIAAGRAQLVLSGREETAILTIAASFGGPADGLASLTVATEDADCPVVAEECGGVSRPVRLSRAGRSDWRVGQTIETDDAELTLVRADRSPIYDPDCMPDRIGFDHLEVFTIRHVGSPVDPEEF